MLSNLNFYAISANKTTVSCFLPIIYKKTKLSEKCALITGQEGCYNINIIRLKHIT